MSVRVEPGSAIDMLAQALHEERGNGQYFNLTDDERVDLHYEVKAVLAHPDLVLAALVELGVVS